MAATAMSGGASRGAVIGGASAEGAEALPVPVREP